MTTPDSTSRPAASPLGWLGQRAAMPAVVGLLAVTLLYPIALTVRTGFADDVAGNTGWTARHLALALRDPVALAGLWNTFLIACATTAVTVLIAVPMAVASARRRFPLDRLFAALVLTPLILPPFVGAIGLKSLLGRGGSLNALLGADWDVLGSARIVGVIVVLALHLYPIMYLNAAAALANTDPVLEQAADLLGASPWRRWRRITLPLMRPGLFAGGTIVFIWSLTELGTPLIFDVSRATTVQIYNGVKEMDVSAQPYILTVLLLALSLLAYAVGKLILGRSAGAAVTRAASHVEPAPIPGVRGWLVTAGFALITGLALIPHLGVVLQSLTPPGGWYRTVLPAEWTIANYAGALGHPLAFDAIRTSVLLSIASLLIATVAGFVIAYLVTRTSLRGRALLDLLAMAPLAVPGLVLAFGYVAVTLRWPFGPGDPLHGVLDVVGSDPNPLPLLALAYAVRRLPYMVRSVTAGLEQAPVDLEEAAWIFGRGRFATAVRIVAPLVMANIIAGGLLVFSFSMLEVSDSLILAQREQDYPITKAMLALTQRLGDGVGLASAMGVWGMALLGLTLLASSLLLGKKMGAVFRA